MDEKNTELEEVSEFDLEDILNEFHQEPSAEEAGSLEDTDFGKLPKELPELELNLEEPQDSVGHSQRVSSGAVCRRGGQPGRYGFWQAAQGTAGAGTEFGGTPGFRGLGQVAGWPGPAGGDGKRAG